MIVFYLNFGYYNDRNQSNDGSSYPALHIYRSYLERFKAMFALMAGGAVALSNLLQPRSYFS